MQSKLKDIVERELREAESKDQDLLDIIDAGNSRKKSKTSASDPNQQSLYLKILNEPDLNYAKTFKTKNDMIYFVPTKVVSDKALVFVEKSNKS